MTKILQCLALGLMIGGVSGMLGIGGGVLLVPVLMWLFDFPQPKAAGITLAILAVPVVLPGAWRYFARDDINRDDLATAAWIAGAFAVGAYVGAEVQVYVPLPALRLAFGLMMIYIAVRFIAHSDSEAASALAGLTAVGAAWLGYWGLRALGRKHLQRPDLGEKIRANEPQGPGEGDYYI